MDQLTGAIAALLPDGPRLVSGSPRRTKAMFETATFRFLDRAGRMRTRSWLHGLRSSCLA
jgi:hypothetical protein